ncbi:hypothetical protein [Sporomusa sp.]|uniref:type IV pilus modification PilV family protein n=1 Tax=Sporomusa sp. TaxID=2078658 RepID=UPI002B58577B|nr:hypothetical protein [Sporomusa sp.]HWR43649.1 hypothetical protein [Sporomusa sp.]
MAGIRSQQGYILVEVILATVIVSVALVAFAAMFISATHATVSGAEYTVLTNLAQEQIESMKVKDWSTENLPYTYDPPTLILNDIHYTRHIVAIDSGRDPDPTKQRIIQVTVKAARTDAQAAVTLVTYVIREMPQSGSP